MLCIGLSNIICDIFCTCLNFRKMGSRGTLVSAAMGAVVNKAGCDQDGSEMGGKRLNLGFLCMNPSTYSGHIRLGKLRVWAGSARSKQGLRYQEPQWTGLFDC